MDILEAIKSRYSVRAFKPDPVPRKVLEDLLTNSLRAPSSSNTQTWEFAVVGGETMKDLRETLAARAFAQDDRAGDIPQAEWTGKYRDRRRQNGHRLYEFLGIGREDVEGQLNWFVSMYRFFDAPNAIIIYMDRDLSTWAVFNCGLVTQTISLAALSHGLGSTIMRAPVGYPDTIRQILNIPDSKQIVIGIALGYPDNDAPVNKFRADRVPLSEVCTWHGVR
jgi:nitroreductase